MTDSNEEPRVSTQDRRAILREPFHGIVTIEFDTAEIEGVGQDLNPDGVHFVADSVPRVKVSLKGRAEMLSGELIRVQALDEGKVGIAVRFTD